MNEVRTSGPARNERIVFFLVCVLMFGYVAVRAALIPLVHDEATSFLAYAQSGHFLPGASMWDANNHYLNSLCGWLGYTLFGFHLLALRWASVLSYLLFSWAAWRLGSRLRHPVSRWLLWTVLLACPFLLDFFSLFRGYGPAMAFLLLSMEQVISHATLRTTRSLVSALLAMATANGFLLALVPLWGVLLLLLVFFCAKDRTQRLVWLVLGVLPFAAGALLARYMAQLGLLYQGSTAGFVEVTVGSLMQRVLGGAPPAASGVATAVVLMAGVAIVRNALRQRQWSSPALIFVGVLWTESIGRIILARSFHVNYGEDRTALHTLLLAIITVAFAADALAARHRLAWLVALPLCVLPLRALITLNVDHTVLWPEQSIPDRFVERVRALENELGRPAVVGTHRHAGLPWSLQYRLAGGESDANASSWPRGCDDVRIVVPFLLEEAGKGFSVVDSSPGNQLYLLRREPPLRTRIVLDTMFSIAGTGQARSASIRLPASWSRDGALLLEVSGRIRSQAQALDLRLALSVSDSAGTMLHGDLVFLNTRRERWEGQPFRTIRALPHEVLADHAELFFWSPDSAAYSVAKGRAILRTAFP